MDLVFLFGKPAAGKLTVARSLAALTGFPVFHNHLVVDVLLEVFEFGSPEFTRLRELFWLETFTEAARTGRSLIFTFTPDATVEADFSRRAAAAVSEHGGRTHFVEVRVSNEEQERRIENGDRRQFRKLTSVDTLQRLRSTGPTAAQPPTEFSIDTERLEPAAAALRLQEALGLGAGLRPRGYPAV